jgi:hypothetical protein
MWQSGSLSWRFAEVGLTETAFCCNSPETYDGDGPHVGNLFSHRRFWTQATRGVADCNLSRFESLNNVRVPAKTSVGEGAVNTSRASKKHHFIAPEGSP